MNAVRLAMGANQLRTLLSELARRGQGQRESGAFLLTDRRHPAGALPQPVTALAYYDDLDPACLTGGITFDARGYSALNAHCRLNSLRVVGDIHTHPGRYVQQSQIDATHPMVAIDGHVALIAPNFANGVTDVSEFGVHVRVDGSWRSFYGSCATEVVKVLDGHRSEIPISWWRRALSWLITRRMPWHQPRRKQ